MDAIRRFKDSRVWHVKVPLVIFSTVEMHESNSVMWQYGCRQRIPPQPQELDMWGRLDEDWTTFHNKFIKMSQYEMSKECLRKRPRRGPINPRSGGHAVDGLTSAPYAHANLIPVQPVGQYGSFIPVTNPFYFTLAP
ncbi:hypothetical protein J1N35_023658 [Gossypium stocksii]|uniref:Uncharacterized protein n=1 Tax=Gossypium stocksii TaxID=47602 RepID=A0A9D3VKB5_9ROSI|nr:hypothetical protein J1N35_023658 [Gossypium stocksii]